MRRKNFVIAIAVLVIFFAGYYYEFINEYFNTTKSIIGLFFVVILCLLFWINNLINKKAQLRNSYHYYDGENNRLKSELDYNKKQLENKENYIKELFEIYNKK